MTNEHERCRRAYLEKCRGWDYLDRCDACSGLHGVIVAASTRDEAEEADRAKQGSARRAKARCALAPSDDRKHGRLARPDNKRLHACSASKLRTSRRCNAQIRQPNKNDFTGTA